MFEIFITSESQKKNLVRKIFIIFVSEERECVFTEDSDIINEDGSEDPSQIMYFCGHHKICNKFNNAKVTRIIWKKS